MGSGDMLRSNRVDPLGGALQARLGRIPEVSGQYGNHFDPIFLDVLLPALSRASALNAIKRRDAEAVVILITGHPHHDETMAALEHGPAMLLRRPIKLTDIRAILEIVFKGKRVRNHKSQIPMEP